MTSDETQLPQHLQCARHVCTRARSAAGQHQWCSAECRRISQAVHGSPIDPDPTWRWAW